MKNLKTILPIILLALISGGVFLLFFQDSEKSDEWTKLYQTLARPIENELEPIPSYNGEPRKFKKPEPVTIEIPSSPTDLQIQQAGWFGHSFFAIDQGKSTETLRASENENLRQLALSLENTSEGDKLKALRDWLSANPNSRWRFAIKDVYLGMRFDRGYFAEAREGWQSLWGELKDTATKNGLFLEIVSWDNFLIPIWGSPRAAS